MQSLKSKIILGLLVNRHIFKFKWKRPPFDPSYDAIVKLRQQTENAGQKFGKLPERTIIGPVTIGAMHAEWIQLPENNPKKAMLYFHGGFYMIGSPKGHRQHVIKFVEGSGINALVFDYRLAPEHPFPAAVTDAEDAYTHLLASGYLPSDIVFTGDSAGGGLCLATLLAIKDKGLPLPAAAAVLSPWTDLMLTGKSHQTNKYRCLSPIGCAESASGYYAGNTDKTHPYVSPLYGDLSGLPPLHISAGGNEILLDDAVMFAEKARKSGVDVTFRSDEGMCHCYPAFGKLFRESKQALEEICQHLKKHAG